MQTMTEQRLNFLEEQVGNRIQIVKRKSDNNKLKMNYVNASSIVLGALIALTLGLDIPEGYEKTQKNIAIVLSALLAIINGWSATVDYKRLWIRQKSTLLDLYQMQNEIGYRKSQNPNASLDDLFEKYIQLWNNDGLEWKQIVKSIKNIEQSNAGKNES
jgi:hypothetical protein